MSVVPISFAEAQAFVERHHRHHGRVLSHKFSVAISDGAEIRGVAIVGRPVARHLDDGWTLEVNRCCTDGVSNGCSMLYGAARRTATALGYRRLVTYTLVEEGGASLRAAGFTAVTLRQRSDTWDTPSRPVLRNPTHSAEAKRTGVSLTAGERARWLTDPALVDDLLRDLRTPAIVMVEAPPHGFPTECPNGCGATIAGDTHWQVECPACHWQFRRVGGAPLTGGET